MAEPNEREWTLMFYFASDNPLAPGIVSQLKAIKQAGFHHDANVIAQFDPHPKGTPTHIFDVNHVMKLRNPQPKIGYVGFDESDPYVYNLIEDKLWRENVKRQEDRNGISIRRRLRESFAKKHIDYAPPQPPFDKKRVMPLKPTDQLKKTPGKNSKAEFRELNPRESLGAFLKFCRTAYPAQHYALFILGHGVVVGNDVFLFDENADEQSLSLKDLGDLLTNFKKNLKGAEFELVSFHSCSVSSLEVAYELQGTANYMLGSQGPAFVGSWPYRQILMRVLKNVDALKTLKREGKDEKARENVNELLRDISDYCFHNSTDFLLAGYSFDLCLCNLGKVTEIKKPLVELSKALCEALRADSELQLVKDFIVLAHWEAQSHWQESYTDLYDFCFCLGRRCAGFMKTLGEDAPKVLGAPFKMWQNIVTACGTVMELLNSEKGSGGKVEKLIVSSDFAGPGHQYSHGLSVFFPWSMPVSDRPIMKNYKDTKFEETTWFTFLEEYFDKTERQSHKTEVNALLRPDQALPPQRDDEQLAEDLLSLVYNGAGRLGSEDALEPKVHPPDPTGDECTCPTIKNYPRDTRARLERERKASDREKAVPTSRTFYIA